MIDDLFCVTLNNMTKQDARFYCKTYGLVYRPNRNNNRGFDLAGDEDSVRAMLEDYIGRYDEIGKIMSEGNYIPDYAQDDFIDPSRSILVRRAEDSKEIKDASRYSVEWKSYDKIHQRKFSSLKEAKEYIKKLGTLPKVEYVELWDLNTNKMIKDKKVKDSDPWHELAHYVLTFEDGHKETDTLPIYVKNQCSSDEEIIDMLQDYYDDKIVAVKQVGWSRMGDSKKIKDDLEPVSEGHREALEEYLQWEGIMGYTEDIIDVYESGVAYVDDEPQDYDNSYDALNAYLEWEGILGYTEAIYDIIENGVESSYYDYMLREKFEDE